MSDTIVDMAKVSQMLDGGWTVTIFKGGMGTVEVRAKHDSEQRMRDVRDKLIDAIPKETIDTMTNMQAYELVDLCDFDGDHLMSEDFTPEQALTRMAYKVFGEVI